jgi:hypothetical protein
LQNSNSALRPGRFSTSPRCRAVVRGLLASQRYERGSTIVTSNLPFEEWTSVLGSERLTGALLDRLTHHVHILEMNGESYRLKHARAHRRKASKAAAEQVDPDTGEITSP